MNIHAVGAKNFACDLCNFFCRLGASPRHLRDNDGIQIGFDLTENSLDILIPHCRVHANDSLEVKGLGNRLTQSVRARGVVRGVNDNRRRVAHDLKAPRRCGAQHSSLDNLGV